MKVPIYQASPFYEGYELADEMTSPKSRDRPFIPGYGIEESDNGLLEWAWVNELMSTEWNYWVCTTRPDGRPHATPVWGVWVENAFYFGGGPDTRKAKNLRKNPNIVIHTESRDDVVILEGIASLEADEQRTHQVQKIYKEKYDLDHPPPFWKVDPTRVMAWKAHVPSDYQSTPTRWQF